MQAASSSELVHTSTLSELTLEDYLAYVKSLCNDSSDSVRRVSPLESEQFRIGKLKQVNP